MVDGWRVGGTSSTSLDEREKHKPDDADYISAGLKHNQLLVLG